MPLYGVLRGYYVGDVLTAPHRLFTHCASEEATEGCWKVTRKVLNRARQGPE